MACPTQGIPSVSVCAHRERCNALWRWSFRTSFKRFAIHGKAIRLLTKPSRVSRYSSSARDYDAVFSMLHLVGSVLLYLPAWSVTVSSVSPPSRNTVTRTASPTR